MGLFKTAAKVAVASSVHGRVQRRQQAKWAAPGQAPPVPVPPVAAPPAPVAAATTAPPIDTNQMLQQLQQLGSLRDAGVLTDEEFARQKSRILGG